MQILFLADVFGAPGRRAVETRLPSLREELGVEFCIVNGENAADGRGITSKLAERILGAGADVITLGNHTWAQRDFAPYLSGTDRVIRPANLSAATPGRGLTVQPAADGTPVAVINLMGQLFLEPAQGPFEVAELLVEEALRETPIVVMDFHAEATSEKIAMARLLDGKATAVLGTHTHVQTNDARVLPGGTAAITDAGMSGPHDSVIGVRAELAIARMRNGMPVRFQPADGDVRLEGVLIECGAGGRATSCEAVRVPIAAGS
jgi:2',3'-cyclic-nucleotide 2'-phosphodiesterase